MYPPELRIGKDHQWVRVEGDRALVGITEFAAGQLEIVSYVYVIPRRGEEVGRSQMCGLAESSKATFELFSPLTGVVTRINELLVAQPELVKRDPHGAGWLLEMSLANPAELEELEPAEAYEASLPRSVKIIRKGQRKKWKRPSAV